MKTIRSLAVLLISCLALFVTGLFIFPVIPGLFVMAYESPINDDQWSVIYSDIAQGSMKPDKAGAVRLPPALASTTKDGYVYVTRRQNGLLMVLFPTWCGKGSAIRGYLYCSRPLVASDLAQQPDPGTNEGTVRIHSAGPWNWTGMTPPYPPQLPELIVESELCPTKLKVYYPDE